MASALCDCLGLAGKNLEIRSVNGCDLYEQEINLPLKPSYSHFYLHSSET